MATLVLSTVGTMLGGPVGGAVGSLLGQSIDQQILGPGPREGPRLGDLSVQTSSYGTAIPKIFGRMRVAGSIIWSTDLTEDSQTEGAKGQPDSVTYSYSASFAVALSSRPIASVGRIWADGKLIRTVDGQFTVNTGFRTLLGWEDQEPDPLISSVEGIGFAPAYRGVAIAIFENLQLAEFGNRIPFLTFEVVAEVGPVSIGELLNELSNGAISCSASSPQLPGYAAHGTTIAAAIEPVVEICGIDLLDDGSALVSPSTVVSTVVEPDIGCSADDSPAPRIERTQVASSQIPSQLSLRYYDPDREYQAGLAKASIENRNNSADQFDLPAVLEAGAAKALAETLLARRWGERDRLTLRLPPAYAALRGGSLVLAPGLDSAWKAHRITIESLAVTVELRPVYATFNSLAADPGRVLTSAGAVPAETMLAVAELPDDGTGSSDSPVVVVAASNDAATWRQVPLQLEIGTSVSTEQTATARAIFGTAATALSSGPSDLFDCISTVDVDLARSSDWLESRDDDAIAAGDNLALLGSELVQFANVTPLGSGRFRLSRLVRGRRGTEWAMALHSEGEMFLLLETVKLRRLPLTRAQTGGRMKVVAVGLADSAQTPKEIVIAGEALRPPSPVRLRAWFDGAGNLECHWVRRSRLGWAWLDGVDVPLGCATETYRVSLSGTAGHVELETSAPQAVFSAAQVAAVGNGDVNVQAMQVGDFGVSRPASFLLTI
jgi:hypothetical protein